MNNFESEQKTNKRDYSFTKNNYKNRHTVCAQNVSTKEITYFKSLAKCAKELDINAGLIKMICEGKNRVKRGISKTTKEKYTFVYITRELTLMEQYNIKPLNWDWAHL